MNTTHTLTRGAAAGRIRLAWIVVKCTGRSECVTHDNASVALSEQLYLSQYHTKIAPCPPKPNKSVPPDAETEKLIKRSLPTPEANSVASATSSFHFLVELLKILHSTFAFIDDPPVRLKPDTTHRLEPDTTRSGLRNAQRGADHRAAARHVNQRQRMQHPRTDVNGTEPDALAGAIQCKRHGPHAHDRNRRRNGRALEVFHLAGLRVGE